MGILLGVATEQAMALNTKDILDPLDSFKTYNEFFMRKLKPESRPVFASDNPHVATQPADARLTLYQDIETCTKVRAVYHQPLAILDFARWGLNRHLLVPLSSLRRKNKNRSLFLRSHASFSILDSRYLPSGFWAARFGLGRLHLGSEPNYSERRKSPLA